MTVLIGIVGLCAGVITALLAVAVFKNVKEEQWKSKELQICLKIWKTVS